MNPLHVGALKTERLSVAIADLPPALSGVRIAQLSDFHYDGVRLSDDLLDEAIAHTNAATPDLIALTGDFITTTPHPISRLAKRLQSLRSRLGTYAVLGNHDHYYPGAQAKVMDTLSASGIHVLWNEIAYPFGAQFPLVGLADYWSRQFKPVPVFEQLDPNVPRLVLSHNPDSAADLQRWRVDLQLSGHTHGGQIVIPGLGNPQKSFYALGEKLPAPLRCLLPFMSNKCHRVVKNWNWAQGLHAVGRNQLYINRGLGSYFPGRFFCPPELTLIELRQRDAG
ncbi:metallophosphoesterase [Vacuolonema iberomarrocanum]|uniref:metallophosphoesterase n=1 Tax=Vacuolonema iberomarrocanum TaxID=3454632 RepID=UPI0019F2B42D|nr:metallophosphoesterase [filamentous cyanobacterium LEGE 07170]